MKDSDAQHAPLLSVTVLNYNYAHYLRQCLDSILGQTLADFELIVINDCSTDNSLSVIEPYLVDSRIRLVNHQTNQGYVSSLIEGCELSRGRYISVVSADDYALERTAFETACRVMEADRDISLFYSAWHEMDDNGTIRHTRRAAESDYVRDGADEFRHLLVSMPILHSGTIIRRDAYESVGGYHSRGHYALDISMWLALCSTGNVAYVNQPLYAYRSHSGNMSNTDGALWQATAEWLQGIDMALARFSDSVLPDKASLKCQAQRHALLAVPTHDIFAGRMRRGWYGYWQACRRHPVLTVLQQRTISLVLRTVLGHRLYSHVRRLGHLGKQVFHPKQAGGVI